jgi:hypothetical protein
VGSVLQLSKYQLLFKEEPDLPITDRQVRRVLLLAYGVAGEEEGPTIRRLKEKYFDRGEEKVAWVFPLLVRTEQGRKESGRRLPSRYVLEGLGWLFENDPGHQDGGEGLRSPRERFSGPEGVGGGRPSRSGSSREAKRRARRPSHAHTHLRHHKVASPGVAWT